MNKIILNFHGLGAPPASVEAPEVPFWLSIAHFRSILDEIKKNATENRPRISLTFDDGYKSDVSIALPELARRSLVATFFVCADRIGEKNFMDTSDIRTLIEAGMTIGSHGARHVDWRYLDEETLHQETDGAKGRIAAVIGRSVQDVAIPFGAYNRRVLTHLRKGKWGAVYTSDGGLCRADAWLRPRQTITRSFEGVPLLDRAFAGGAVLRSVIRNARILCKSIR